MGAPEKYKGQYNHKHKEIILEYRVTLNLVMLATKKEEDVDKWFQDKMALLETGVQLNSGIMNAIAVEKMDSNT